MHQQLFASGHNNMVRGAKCYGEEVGVFEIFQNISDRFFSWEAKNIPECDIFFSTDFYATNCLIKYLYFSPTVSLSRLVRFSKFKICTLKSGTNLRVHYMLVYWKQTREELFRGNFRAYGPIVPPISSHCRKLQSGGGRK